MAAELETVASETRKETSLMGRVYGFLASLRLRAVRSAIYSNKRPSELRFLDPDQERRS
jgi:hypothetical protein